MEARVAPDRCGKMFLSSLLLCVMPATYSVLLVEDDPMISRTLSVGLRYEGFALHVAASVSEAMRLLQQQHFALMVLDVGLPDGDGISLCKALRVQHPATPILMLSARTDETSAVAGIEGGADDYVRKPCGLRELSARMQRLLVMRQPQTDASGLLSFGAIQMDQQKHCVSVAGTIVQLGKKEYAVLFLLMRAAGKPITREQILNQFDDDNGIYDRTIDSHLSHLRRKLKDAGATERIVAIYGVGYRLEAA